MTNQSTALATVKPVATAFFSRIEVPHQNARCALVKSCLELIVVLLLSVTKSIPLGSFLLALTGVALIAGARSWRLAFSVGLRLQPGQFVLGTQEGFPIILRGVTKIRHWVLARMTDLYIVQERPWTEHKLQLELKRFGTYEVKISLCVNAVHEREAVYWIQFAPSGVEQVVKRELARLVSHCSGPELSSQLQQKISDSSEFVAARVQVTVHNIEPWIEPLEIDV